MGKQKRVKVDEDVARAERAAHIFALLRRGWSFREIGTQLECSAATVHRSYRAALAEIPAQDLAEHRDYELIIIQTAMRDLFEIVEDDEVNARTRVEALSSLCAWSRHRAILLGLNAPSRSVQRVVTLDAVDARIAELTERLEGNDAPPMQIEG